MLGNVWKADDPRDALDRAGKHEIWEFAKKNGVTEVTFEMPTLVARRILREKGLTNIAIPDRPLGTDRPTVYNSGETSAPPKPTGEAKQMSADDLLMEEYRRQNQVADAVKGMGIKELRSECKRRGIRMARTDNMDSLREKLRGENAA